MSLPLNKAIENGTDIIALNDSQCLRFIDEINGVNTEIRAKLLAKEIKKLANLKNPDKKRLLILRKNLYQVQFQPDYMELIIDRLSDYDRANKGFTINGIKYKEFVGTNGGVKNSTIIYVNEDIYDVLKEKMDAGRNTEVELVPSKFQAYEALMCSGSVVVSMPKGIIVVKDLQTSFQADVLEINDENDGEPIITPVKDKTISLDCSDGCGMMLPELAKRWNAELGGNADEVLSGLNVRGLPWIKGMLFDDGRQRKDSFVLKIKTPFSC